jgi:hypothetical protein
MAGLVAGAPFIGGRSAAVAKTVDLKTTFEIQGKVPDMQHYIESSGFRFRVDFQDIEYSGKVHRTLVEHTSADKATVWMALQNAVLTIQRTEIDGRRHNAQCGPMQLVLGNRRELWIALDVQRNKVAGTEKLELVQTRFELPRDNWSIGSPTWVETSGFGMTKSKVISGLRKGLSKQSATVEKQMMRTAPDILARVENQVVENLDSRQPQVASGDAPPEPGPSDTAQR